MPISHYLKEEALVTAQQTNNIEQTLKAIVGTEKITVHTIGSAIYVFGSEQAVLQISKSFPLHTSKNEVTFDYCEKLATHVLSFRLKNV